MAILSFAHLKNKKNPENEKAAPPPSSGPMSSTRQPTKPGGQGGVLSFAHLKKTQPVTVHEEKKQEQRRTAFRIPAVMPSALICATNYCQGCNRFMPAENSIRDESNPYGRCLRYVDTDEYGNEWDVWRIIPAHATVSRCFFMRKEK